MKLNNLLGISQLFYTVTLLLYTMCVRGDGEGDDKLGPKAIALNPIDLRILVETEVKVMGKLEELILNKQSLPKDVLAAALNYTSDFKDTFGSTRGLFPAEESDDRIKAVTKNPIATYRCLWRYVNALPGFKEKLAKVDGMAELLQVLPPLPLSNNDVMDAMLALLRIQYVYALNPKQIADGIISGVATGVELNALLCYELGVLAFNYHFHTLSIEWLEVALSKASKDQTADAALIKSALESSIEKHDRWFDGRWEFSANFYDRKLLPIQNFDNYSQIRQRQRQLLAERFREDPSSGYGFIRFWEMCSQGSIQTSAIHSQKMKPLKCFYETTVSAYWTLAPLKVEMLSRQPAIYQLYDILQDTQINLLKNSVSAVLRRSTVIDENNIASGGRLVDPMRTSVGTRIDEENIPGLENIPVIIQTATGLKVLGETAAEPLQVAAYAFGGHYDVHHDYYDPGPQDIRGGRIATFMFYLSEPELGGYTVFPHAGVVAKPVKGSAVVWHNLLSDGSQDYYTYHGACPVVLGDKWVANKWIGVKEQFAVRKCSPERSKVLEFPYAYK